MLQMYDILCIHPEFPLASHVGPVGCNVMTSWLHHPLFTDMAATFLVHDELFVREGKRKQFCPKFKLLKRHMTKSKSL